MLTKTKIIEEVAKRLIPIFTHAIEFHSGSVFVRSQSTKRPGLIVLTTHRFWEVLAVVYNRGSMPH
jgi:hypothetical protein